MILHGGTASGFRHVTQPPPLNLFNFYHISASKPSATGINKPANLIVRQVTNGYQKALKRYPNDVFVLDKGREIWQWNSKKSSGKEKFKAAEFVRAIIDGRKHEPVLKVFDEGGSGASRFVNELTEEHAHPSDSSEAETEEDSPLATPASSAPVSPVLYRLSDATGQVMFTQVVDLQSEGPSPTLSDFDSADAFILDDSADTEVPAVDAWIGKDASVVEKKYAVQYAQQYLWGLNGSVSSGGKKRSSTSVVRLVQGNESSRFLKVIGARA
jgi:gelsolin